MIYYRHFEGLCEYEVPGERVYSIFPTFEKSNNPELTVDNLLRDIKACSPQRTCLVIRINDRLDLLSDIKPLLDDLKTAKIKVALYTSLDETALGQKINMDLFNFALINEGGQPGTQRFWAKVSDGQWYNGTNEYNSLLPF